MNENSDNFGFLHELRNSEIWKKNFLERSVKLHIAYFGGDSYNINSVELLYRSRILREIISEETDTAVQILLIRKSLAGYSPNRNGWQDNVKIPSYCDEWTAKLLKSEKNKNQLRPTKA